MVEYQDDPKYSVWEQSYVLPDEFFIDSVAFKVGYVDFRKNLKTIFANIFNNITNNAFLKILYKSFFKWSPIFKKTSYFGLFVSSKNK